MLETGDESNTAGPGMFDVSEQGRTGIFLETFFYCGRGEGLHDFSHCQSDLSGISIVFST